MAAHLLDSDPGSVQTTHGRKKHLKVGAKSMLIIFFDCDGVVH